MLRRTALALGLIIASLAPAAAHAAPLPCTEVSAIGERCPVWNSVYHGPSGWGPDVPWAITASPDASTIYVSGDAWNVDTTSTDAVTRAFDAATGAERWTATYEGGEGTDIPIASVVSPDGKTLFVGVISNRRLDEATFNIVADFATLAYEASTGTLKWAREWSIPGSDTSIAWPSSIAVSPDGSRVYITGYSRSFAPEADLPQFTVVGYDADDGHELWSFRNITGGANEILVSPGGNRVFILGSHQPYSAMPRYHLVALEAGDPDRLGTVDWTATYLDENGGANYGWQLAMSPDGTRIFASGQANVINGTGAHSSMDTLAYSAATGQQLWSASSVPVAPMITGANGLVVGPSGDRVYITGYEFSLQARTSSWVTIAYDAATGAQVWRTEFSQGSWNFPYAMAISPDGSSVYVTGMNAPATAPVSNPPVRLAATVAYDAATGTQRWIARHSQAPDFLSAQGAAITATQDGVFVAASLSQGVPIVQGAPVDNDQGDWSVLRYQP